MIYICNFNFVLTLTLNMISSFFLVQKKRTFSDIIPLLELKSLKSFANKCQVKFRNELHKLYDQIRTATANW